MLISTLVSNALYLSLYDRELQPAINGGVIDAALNSLNFIFSEWRDLIPYAVEYEFNDSQELLNTKFVSVDNVDYLLSGNVKTPLKALTLTRFNEYTNVTDLTGVPTVYYFDSLKQNINVYPFPSTPGYKFIVWGRAALGPLTLCSSLGENVPIYMANALQYELAKRLADETGTEFNQGKNETRLKLIEQLKSKREINIDTPINNVFGSSSSGVAPFPYFYHLSGGR